MKNELLSIENLSLSYIQGNKEIKVLEDVTFSLGRGETLGIVGESGCGKSTLAKAITRVLPGNAKLTAGRVIYDNRDIIKMDTDELRGIRGNEIGMIFQNPMTALNPTMKLKNQMYEVLKHRGLSESEMENRAIELYKLVGIPAPEKRLNEYIQEYSGGMRQRAMIAMVLASEPKLLIADEPTTALDVTIQHQIIELLRYLVGRMGMSLILISHDFGVISELCREIAVMYAGKIIEKSDRNTIFSNPKHPYTEALLGSIPTVESGEKLSVIDGMPPDLSTDILGCPFCERCKYVNDICRTEKPALAECGVSHVVACHKIRNTEV